MQFGYSEVCLAHDPGPRHPETPDRLRAIRERLKRKHGVEYVEADPVDVDEIASVHDRSYVEEIEEFCAQGGGNWDPDTTAVEETWDAIRCSAGQARWAVERALEGDDGRKTPFSIGRPPGHHAVVDDAMGFCFVNNVAVAAQWALESEDYDVDRVAIVDWDVHHGNGTQDIFYDREDVFFVSIHEKGLYPGTGEIDERGEGDGDGTTMNLPMPAGTDDVDYLAAFDGPIGTALEEYGPDLVIVSAGFDAHRHDPISRIRLSTEAYALLTDRLRGLTDRVGAAFAFVLEGGYSLDVLADSVSIVHETFDGREPIEPDDDEEVSDGARTVIEDVIEEHGLEYDRDDESDE
ncbi:histone deacetylase [Halobiforma lacisalsi AJ5]|uniref:Histone deacetylase n=1 Tax=Natronobacterium lacisalsi AJ5 TaxID=358396 RepID=M0LPL8_NATLA|nr:histone deacetylase [Halobiforma lacisalsi]APW96768.1 histone deacetylase [Halobiforma lacisalsi AJ5]EMA35038.1 histone deacetylase [Halobiforma lacisalsi AJ5]